MDENIKKEIILDNYQYPKNKCTIDDESYVYINSKNESCIDDINIWIKFKDDLIEDVKFDGEACAISTASTSILLDKIIGKDITYAKKFIQEFYNMIEEKPYDKDFLEEALVFDEIYKQANRINCALLPYKSLLKALDEYKK